MTEDTTLNERRLKPVESALRQKMAELALTPSTEEALSRLTGEEAALEELLERISAQQAEIKRLNGKLQNALQVHQELWNEARLDTLTGVYNRNGFYEAVENMTRLQAVYAPGNFIYLLVVDIDHFKNINDTYGHATGDSVIRAVAATLQQNIRDYDSVARWGGEEFVVALFGLSLEEAEKKAENLRSAIEAQNIIRDEQSMSVIKVTGSIGVSSKELMNAEEIDDRVHHADLAMYQAKQEGRNRVVVNRDN